MKQELDLSDLVYAKAVVKNAAYKLGFVTVSQDLIGDGLLRAAKVWVWISRNKNGRSFEEKRVVWRKLIHKHIYYEMVNSVRRMSGRMPTNHKRDVFVKTGVNLDNIEDSDNTEERVIAKETINAIWRKLNRKQKLVFEMYYVENRTMPEVGRLVGKERGIIWYHVDRIRIKAQEVAEMK